MIADGDVILICGEDEVSLRVSSIILSLASPVFKAMLQGNFAEGRAQRSSITPQRIKLREDSPEGMIVFCTLLHRHTIAETCLDSDDVSGVGDSLLQFALIVDKYNCATSFALYVETILARILDAIGSDNSKAQSLSLMATYTVSAYLLQEAKSFAVFTRFMLTRCNERFSILEKHPISTYIPQYSLCEYQIRTCY